MKKTACIWLAVLLLLSACAKSAVTWQEQYDLGVRFLNQGSYEEAIIAFQAAIEIDPRQADAYISLADAYVAQGDAERARQVLTDALAVVADTDAIRRRLDALEESTEPKATPGTIPVYLLTHQAVYSPEGRLDAEHLYGYDAQGYILSHEVTSYSSDNGSSSSRVITYEYTGEYADKSARCRVIDDRRFFESEEDWLAAQYETSVAPGEPIGYAVGHHHSSLVAYVDPLFGNIRAAVSANGGVLTNEDGDEGWAYAVYTFDEAGNPVSIVTYDETDTVTGTAALEWQLLQ